MDSKTKNENIIYGVDITKEVTPVMVRDAMIQCYYEAHCSVLELAKNTFGNPPDEVFEEMKKSHVKEIIENLFFEEGESFKNPNKIALKKILNRLKKIAACYREPEIIDKHVDEMKLLISKLD